MSTARPTPLAPHPSPSDWLALVALSFMWGTSFLFTKIALEQLQPVTVVTFRLGLGSVVLLAMLWWRDSPLPRRGRLWLHLLVLSALGNTLPFSSSRGASSPSTAVWRPCCSPGCPSASSFSPGSLAAL